MDALSFSLSTFDSAGKKRVLYCKGRKGAFWCVLLLEECRSSWNPGLARAALQGQPALGLAPFPGGSSNASFLACTLNAALVEAGPGPGALCVA